MVRIPVRIEDYKNYVDKYGTNKLDSKNEIYGIGSFPPKFVRDRLGINEEIFNGTENYYGIIEKDHNYILIKFYSKSNKEYRIDLYKEKNYDIWHIGFSYSENSTNNPMKYENPTNRNESIDVFSRLVWILKDLNMDVEYCIGSTGDVKKDNIYKYMMRFVSNWEKRDTDDYKFGWGIYFKI